MLSIMIVQTLVWVAGAVSAIRIFRVFHDGSPRSLRDQAGVVKMSRHRSDAFHVFTMVLPGAVARAKLVDAASVRIDHRAGRGVGTFVEIIWHAVLVAVQRKNLSADLITRNRHAIPIFCGYINVPQAGQQFTHLVAGNFEPAVIL